MNRAAYLFNVNVIKDGGHVHTTAAITRQEPHTCVLLLKFVGFVELDPGRVTPGPPTTCCLLLLTHRCYQHTEVATADAAMGGGSKPQGGVQLPTGRGVLPWPLPSRCLCRSQDFTKYRAQLSQPAWAR